MVNFKFLKTFVLAAAPVKSKLNDTSLTLNVVASNTENSLDVVAPVGLPNAAL